MRIEHYIYKINAKEQLPLDQVKDEITSVLKNQSIRDAMEKIANSYSVDTLKTYTGRRHRRKRVEHAHAADEKSAHGPVPDGACGQPAPAQPPANTTTGGEPELMAKPVVVVTGIAGNLGSGCCLCSDDFR